MKRSPRLYRKTLKRSKRRKPRRHKTHRKKTPNRSRKRIVSRRKVGGSSTSSIGPKDTAALPTALEPVAAAPSGGAEVPLGPDGKPLNGMTLKMWVKKQVKAASVKLKEGDKHEKVAAAGFHTRVGLPDPLLRDAVACYVEGVAALQAVLDVLDVLDVGTPMPAARAKIEDYIDGYNKRISTLRAQIGISDAGPEPKPKLEQEEDSLRAAAANVVTVDSTSRPTSPPPRVRSRAPSRLRFGEQNRLGQKIDALSNEEMRTLTTYFFSVDAGLEEFFIATAMERGCRSKNWWEKRDEIVPILKEHIKTLAPEIQDKLLTYNKDSSLDEELELATAKGRVDEQIRLIGSTGALNHEKRKGSQEEDGGNDR